MATNPLINGVVYDHSSVEINIKGTRYLRVSGSPYSDSLEPGKLRGAAAKVLARTRGEYSAEGSFKISKKEGLPDHRRSWRWLHDQSLFRSSATTAKQARTWTPTGSRLPHHEGRGLVQRHRRDDADLHDRHHEPEAQRHRRHR